MDAAFQFCLEKEYMGYHRPCIHKEHDKYVVGHYADGCDFVLLLSDDDVKALLCAMDVCSNESAPDHFWDSAYGVVGPSNSDCRYGLQFVVEEYFNDNMVSRIARKRKEQ